MTERDRNPLVIPVSEPEAKPLTRGCPFCGERNYDARSSGGTTVFACLECGTTWSGGIGQVPQDPTVPSPPMNPRDRPLVEFFRNSATQEIQEFVRRQDLTPDYRRGAPIPGPGDDDDV